MFMTNINSINQLLMKTSGSTTLHYDLWTKEHLYQTVGENNNKK